MESSEGIIFAATGDDWYIREAAIAAEQVRRRYPDIAIALYTDVDTHFDAFDQVRSIGSDSYGVKIDAMLQSEFDKTLFLDTDVYVEGGIDDLFELLDRFDIAAAHAPIRQSPERTDAWASHEIRPVPDSFPEFNTGVIAFRNNHVARQLLQSWQQIYEDAAAKADGPVPDQPSFRDALYHDENVRFSTLTPEYNCRYEFPTYVHGAVKVFHGRSPSPAQINTVVNASEDPRVLLLPWGVVSRSNVFLRVGAKLLQLKSRFDTWFSTSL